MDQFLNHLEYMVRIFLLFVYFIDELPEPLTMRSFLEFLRQKLVVEKEEIPYFNYPLQSSMSNSFEFCGFVRGNDFSYVELSPELDKEVARINRIILPSDEELVALLDQENADGCQLIRAAQYSGVLPGGEGQSETLMDEKEWDEYEEREKEEMEKKKLLKKMSKRGLIMEGMAVEEDGDGNEQKGENDIEEGEEEEDEEEEEELPKEYLELMEKDKRRKEKWRKNKEKLRKSHHHHHHEQNWGCLFNKKMRV